MALPCVDCFNQALNIYKLEKSTNRATLSKKCQQLLDKIKLQYDMDDTFSHLIIEIDKTLDELDKKAEIEVKIILDAANILFDLTDM